MIVDALSVTLKDGTRVFNLPPPTQGLASLLILAIHDRIRQDGWRPDNVEGIHALVEATKQAFIVRDRVVTDPNTLPSTPASWPTDEAIAKLAAAVPVDKASPCACAEELMATPRSACVLADWKAARWSA